MSRIELNAKISARIIAWVEAGLTLPQAFNKVLGHMAYECLVEELYEELNAA